MQLCVDKRGKGFGEDQGWSKRKGKRRRRKREIGKRVSDGGRGK